MATYEIRHEVVEPTYESDGSITEIDHHEIEIPDRAIGVNTTAITSSPTIAVVTWLQEVEE